MERAPRLYRHDADDGPPPPLPQRVRVEVEAIEPVNIAVDPPSSSIKITTANLTVKVISPADSPKQGKGGVVLNGDAAFPMDGTI